MIFLLFFLIGFLAYILYKKNKQEQESQVFDRDWEIMKREENQRTYKRIDELKKNPIKCEICSKKKGKRVNFEGLACYHCKKCGGHGFASIYSDICTNCSNLSGDEIKNL